MRASAHQAKILDFVRSGAGHGLVEATAGSGKTTTLVLVARLLVDEIGVPAARVAFLAFNRSAAAQLRERLPAGVHALTLHALGRRVLLGAGRSVALDDDKYMRLATERGAPPHARAGLVTAARFARLDLTPYPIDPQPLRQRYGIELELPGESAAAYLSEMLAGSTATPSVDFTDLLYQPVVLALPVPAFDFVCVDEAQDLSRLALRFVMRLVEAGARALFVGDASQAIYGFAGADAASLERVAAATSATRLPLSVSYRCPTRHVVLARRLSPRMVPAPGARTGRVRVTNGSRLLSALAPGDLVLSRTNGPLLDTALAAASTRLPTVVLGDERLANSTELVARLGAANGLVDRLALELSLAKESRRLEREMPLGLELPGALDATSHQHKAAAVALATARSGRVEDVNAALAMLLGGDAPEGHALLSTVHKAKGREADRVFVLAPEELGIGADRRPATAWPHTAWLQDAGAVAAAARPRSGPEAYVGDPATDDRAEANVLFVALTRAKRELVLVEKEPGAIRRRLQRHAASGPPGWLAGWWDDVLRLALMMSRQDGSPALSSRHGQAWRVQDPGGKARGRRRGSRGGQDRPGDDHG